MVEKELKKLSRRELLEILIMQSKRVEKLEAQLEEANKKLDDRRIRLEKVGSIAEAALALNNVFEAAQIAAEQYLENVEIVCKQEETADGFEDNIKEELDEGLDISFSDAEPIKMAKRIRISDRQTHKVD